MKNDESLFGSRTHESIYHQIGGEPVLNAAVDLFYEKVLADKRIKQFFDGADMPRLRKTQKQFLMYALGGSADAPSISLSSGVRATNPTRCRGRWGNASLSARVRSPSCDYQSRNSP